MLDLETLRIIRREQPNERNFSFVGLRLSPVDAAPEFWLPQGFQAFPKDNFAQTVGLFFDLFRVFRSFVTTRGLREDQRADKRDPLSLGDDGLNFALSADTPLLTFAKLNLLDAILESFDEMVISAIVSKQASRPPESHEEVSKYLHKAIYLDDDRIHFDVLPSQRREVLLGATQLVRLFSYVYCELASQLYGPESIRPDIVANAAAFKEEHLSEGAGLFVEGAFKTTLQILKEVLEKVDRATPYKDDDFWQLFSAIEVFLYGDIAQEADADGVVWGISDFHPVWEEMCHAYATEQFEQNGDRKVLFADTRQGANDFMAGRQVVNNFGAYPFRLELGNRKRPLLPDLVAQRLAEETARVRFASMISVTKVPSHGAVPDKIVIRASPTIDAAQSWLDEIKRLVTKAGWHSVGSPRGQAVFRKMPAKKFDLLYEQTVQKYLRQVGNKTEYFVMDFKYQHPHEYCGTSISGKIQADILKQNVYELALQYHLEDEGIDAYDITSQFIVPLYSPGASGPKLLTNRSMPLEMQGRTLCPTFLDAGIELVALPFGAVAEAYTRLK
jgi:hypothetical protein